MTRGIALSFRKLHNSFSFLYFLSFALEIRKNKPIQAKKNFLLDSFEFKIN